MAASLPLTHEELRPYFRVVYDHLLRDLERVTASVTSLTSVLEANLIPVSVRRHGRHEEILCRGGNRYGSPQAVLSSP